jgi:hypothetical protein
MSTTRSPGSGTLSGDFMEFASAGLKSHQTTSRFTSELPPEQREPETRAEVIHDALAAARDASREQWLGATAVWEQGRLARMRAAQLREDSQRLRRGALERRRGLP